MDFKCRFKGKITRMTKDGILGQILTDRSHVQKNLVHKPFQQIDNLITDQLNNLINQNKYNSYNVSEYQEYNNQNFDYYSQKNVLNKKDSNMVQQNQKIIKSLNYKPYNYKDYQDIQQSLIKIRGGLGPNINNKEWIQKKDQKQKVFNYSEKVKIENKEKIIMNKPQIPHLQYLEVVSKIQKQNYLEFD